MCKSYIYNYNENLYLQTLQNAIKRAIENDFQFVKFNGILYFIDKNKIGHKINVSNNSVDIYINM